MNPYDILGVPQDASKEDIKSAYRKLVMQFHPDRNPGDKEAEARFKEIQSAYEQIEKPQNVNMNFEGGNSFFDDFINNVFNFRPEGSRSERRVELHLQLEIAISFWEAVRGCEKTLTVPKSKTCETCKGSGAAEMDKCNFCSGEGVIVQRQGVITMQTTCPHCSGRGQKVKIACKDCKYGSIRDDGTVNVQIPSHIDNGSILRIIGLGNSHFGKHGDLYLTIRVGSHDIFVRQNNDLTYKMPITYTQAVFGATIKVPTLDKEIDLVIPPNTKTGEVFRIKGHGFKARHQGDLVILVEIETIDPNEVELEYKVLLEGLAKWENENVSPSMKLFRQKTK